MTVDVVLPPGWSHAKWAAYLNRRAGLCDAAHKDQATELRSRAARHDRIAAEQSRPRGGVYAMIDSPATKDDPAALDDSDRLEREAIMSVEAEQEREARCKQP